LSFPRRRESSPSVTRDKAKKAKDDDAMKSIAAQMKPLIAEFDCGRQDMKSAVDDAYEALEAVINEAVDLKALVS
jgi:hypothetical protein